jgi:hypothetical protein
LKGLQQFVLQHLTKFHQELKGLQQFVLQHPPANPQKQSRDTHPCRELRLTTRNTAGIVATMNPGSVIDAFPSRAADMSPEMRQLELQTFEIAFESALEELAAGNTLELFCASYHVRLVPSRFRTWVFQNTKRRNAYIAAKAVGAEAVEDELIRIADGKLADGTPSPNDVQRSQLMISTRRWLLTVWNRERYGEVKKVEQTTTTRIDPASLSTPELQRQLLEALGIDDDSLSSSSIDSSSSDDAP